MTSAHWSNGLELFVLAKSVSNINGALMGDKLLDVGHCKTNGA